MNENEFPDSDEEYDLVPNDVNTSSINYNGPSDTVKTNIPQNTQKSLLQADEFPDPDEDFDFIENSTPLATVSQNGIEKSKKRTFEELERDAAELLGNEQNGAINFDDFDYPIDPVGSRSKRPCWDRPMDIINAIRQESNKKRLKLEDNDAAISKIQKEESKRETISLRIPSWRFVALTRPSDSQRIYIRYRPKESLKIGTKSSAPELLNMDYYQLKEEAEKILVKKATRESLSEIPHENTQTPRDDQLWVDKYRPKSYMELLSDETVNRTFLRWIKLWDKVVFGREIKVQKKPNAMFEMKKFGKNEEIELVDKRNFPIHKIALLSGPPGLGKTTLAHLVAKQAGYNIVEINASDDRGPEAFRQALLSSTQMRSLMGDNPKPNCLVLDEIDGAPVASIELLLKFVQGKLAKGKKSKEAPAKDSEYCKRPVVCICNEVYTPALKSLRQMAYIIHVPKVSIENLTNRLLTIARREGLNVDQATLAQLADRSGCDIRSCLGALQYMGEDCGKTNVSLSTKHTKQNIFQSWRETLQVPMDRSGPLPIKERVDKILNIAYNENSERFTQGIFENFPINCHEKMSVIATTLEWFQIYDRITKIINSRQEWILAPYRNYCVVSWHLGFAGGSNPKLSYPYAASDAAQKLTRNMAILSMARKYRGQDTQTITLDLAPFLYEILNPKLRSVTNNLYSSREKQELERLIDIMLNLGISFVHEKREDGVVDHQIEPNLFKIGVFPNCKVRRGLSFAVTQIVAQELEAERVRRAAIIHGVADNSEKSKTVDTVNSEADTNAVRANHLSELEPVAPKERKYRNFFENFKKTVKPGTSENIPAEKKVGKKYRDFVAKYGVWYKYKEGYSNAVRRKVTLEDIL